MSWYDRLGSLMLGMVVLLGVASSAQAADTSVKLEPQNNSGEAGTATLTPEGNSTKVVLNVTGAPAPPSAPPRRQGVNEGGDGSAGDARASGAWGPYRGPHLLGTHRVNEGGDGSAGDARASGGLGAISGPPCKIRTATAVRSLRR